MSGAEGKMREGTGPSEVDRMNRALDVFPPGFTGNPLNLLFLDPAAPIGSASAYLRALDSPELCEDRREFLTGSSSYWPFPTAALPQRPDPRSLSDTLFERFEEAWQMLPTQRDVGRLLLDRVGSASPDIVLLMIVDGLSYFDLPETEDAVPCLVSGVTTTAHGHRSVLGRPSISQRLFSYGYKSQLGFTYFDPDVNPLAADLYAVFGSSKVRRIAELGDALLHLRRERLAMGYVQVTSSGLDQLCHQHYDRPLIHEHVADILRRFEQLISCLSAGGRKVVACLTADHGILWRDQLKEDERFCPELAPEDTHHPRYVLGGVARDCARVWRSDGTTYSLLRFPYLTRPLKHTEWGVHGGISAWESVVPLVIRET